MVQTDNRTLLLITLWRCFDWPLVLLARMEDFCGKVEHRDDRLSTGKVTGSMEPCPSTKSGFDDVDRNTLVGHLKRMMSLLGSLVLRVQYPDKGKSLRIQIPLPPLEEQKRIAGILDAADILRAKRREPSPNSTTSSNPPSSTCSATPSPTQNSRRSYDGIGNQVHRLSWQITSWSEVGVPLITAKIVKENFQRTNEFIASESYDTWKRYKFQPEAGDVIFTRQRSKGEGAWSYQTIMAAFATKALVLQPDQTLVAVQFRYGVLKCHLSI